MTKTRIIGLALAVLCFGPLAGPASADGLSRFEKSIKPLIPDGAMTYKSAKALGDDGFVLEDVVITPPPEKGKDEKPQPIGVKTITVESLDFNAVEKQQPPLYAKIKFDGVTSGSNAGGFDLKQLAGIDKVSADFGLSYELDADKKTFTMDRLELNLNGLGKLETSFEIDGVKAGDVANPAGAMDDASLKSAKLTYDDHSLLGKAVPIAAAMQGIDPKAAVQMAIVVLDGARADQSAATQKDIDTLVAFIEDFQKPKGPLKIVLSPPDKVTNAQLTDAKTADDYVKLLGIEVSYAGTRTSKPMDAPPPDKK